MQDTIAVALIITIPSTLSAVAGIYSALKIKETHILVNSRLSQLLNLTQSASFAAGQKDQKSAMDAERLSNPEVLSI